MKKYTVFVLALTVLSGQAFAAQLYRWVDGKGNVEWRDTPPPAAAKSVELRNVAGNTIDTTEVPYSVQQAAKNFPVTLWTTNCGETCEKARALLIHRGVPYTERDAQSDVEAFKKAAGGSMQVPLLFVGDRKLNGFLESEWNAALDVAGYPKTAIVPVRPPVGTVAAETSPAAAETHSSSAAPAPPDGAAVGSQSAGTAPSTPPSPAPPAVGAASPTR